MDSQVLVIGATQGTGYDIVNLLLRDGYRVRALERDPAKAQGKLNSAVAIVEGDITKQETLAPAMKGVDHIIFTAGVGKIPASERLVSVTEYEGVKNTLTAAREWKFNGRFLYMTAIGVTKSSWAATLLNLIKGNTLKWRKLAEGEIRRSGFDYTIIRTGILTNGVRGQKTIEVSQSDYPLSIKYKISRADVAEVFVQALKHPRTRRTTFDVVWAKGTQPQAWDVLFGQLKPDA